MRQDQSQAAQRFATTHEQEISRVRQLLAASGSWLIDEVGTKVFDSADLAKAKALSDAQDMTKLFSFVRQRASIFVVKHHSGAFWNWVDAVGFFWDATGTRWPYMTDELRANSLLWAQEGAQSVMEVRYAA